MRLLPLLPFRVEGPIKVLGVFLGSSFGFIPHLEGVMARASMRHGIMARLSRSTWGLEAGLLRSTHAALLTGLMTYGYAVAGPGAYDKVFERLDTQGANVTARRITGISRSARLETLHLAAALWSATNQYLQHVAKLMTRALSATECTLATRFGVI